MNAILHQLELNQTFFIEFGIIVGLFSVLSRLYFRPFLKLFDARRQRLADIRANTERLIHQSHEKMTEYQRILAEEQVIAKNELNSALMAARQEEAVLLSKTRDETKKMIQEAAHAVSLQREQLQKQLQTDVDSLSQMISKRLLS